MKRRWLLLATFFLTGCLTSNGLQYEAVSEQNVYRIARTRKGMSESQVLKIMHKPYSYESFQIDDDVYDVWFYVTRTTGLDQTRMVPQNLTPLTFKNGVLVGSGYYWYYYAMREQAAEMAAQNPPPPKPPTQEQEDKEFEQLLRPPEKPADQPKQEPTTSTFILTSDEQVSTIAKQSSTGSQLPQWTPSPIGAIQKQKISKVRIGMTETEVTNLIGSPDSYETYTISNDVYDVWFYEVTNRSGNPTNVPLTFKNSNLIATTQRYYNKVKAKANPDSVNGYNKDADRMIEDENEQNFDFW